VSPFRLKKIFAYKRNKANLDPFHLCFTISLQNFTSLFSLLFASFRFKFFASLHFVNFSFEVKRIEAKFKSIFSLFFAFFTFFRLFHFFSLFSLFTALNFSLRFDLVIFASKRNKVKRNSSLFFSLFSLFFTFFFAFFHFFSRFFHFFSVFSLNFRFTSIFLLNFRLFYLRFRFRFLVFHIEVNHVKSGFFFASKRNEIFASISNFASEAKVRAHPNS
jgi:hypothetical protein